MRAVVIGLALSLSPAAHAAEVVWLTPAEPGSPFEAALLAKAQPRRSSLSEVELVSAAEDARVRTREAHDALERTLKEVRAFETRLDGELIIMDDLQRALDAVQTLSNEADRDRVFRALTYQGFAVDRFFADTLARDDRAAPFRTTLNEVTYVRPWTLAVALQPDRELTAYEVAESPQRVAYGQLSQQFRAEALPGTVTLGSADWLDQGGSLFVDGVPVEGSSVKVLPGTHWVHVEVQGHVIDATRVEVEPGRSVTWTPQQTVAGWGAWIRQVKAGASPAVDAALQDDVRTLGGEVWFVVAGDKQPTVLSLTVSPAGEATWRTVDVRADSDTPADSTGFSVAVGAGLGWVYSGDFYTQDPVSAPHTVGTVNSFSLDLDAQVAWDTDLIRVAVGVDTLVTPGEHHVALTGDSAWRARPYPYVAVGLPVVQLSVGYLLPYHVAFGPQLQVPLIDGLEIQGRATFGMPSERKRENGSIYKTEPFSSVQVGVGWRFR